MPAAAKNWEARLPFFYGWLIIAGAFVTMAIAVTSRTAFSLLLPPLIDEFGWDRALASGAFSFGFLVSAIISPLTGRFIDLYGPRLLIAAGVCITGGGLLLAPLITSAWHLYLTIGIFVGAGANLMSYTAHSTFLPNWFVKRRALAIGIAFSGVGIGAITLLPWFQRLILESGWRTACWSMGLLLVIVVSPFVFLARKQPEDVGLSPDGDATGDAANAAREVSNIVDPVWAATNWTLASAMRTKRFWLIFAGYFCSMFAWYAVQVHQTKYLTEIGFAPLTAAWALGFVAVVAIPGQILLGALSDRIGREWIWSTGCLGLALSYAALIALETSPTMPLLWAMVLAQGFLGYSLTSVFGAIVAEIFEGPNFGSIFGAVNVAMLAGGAAGPWFAGVLYDAAGTYLYAWALAITLCIAATACIWIAAPRHVRMVAGRAAANR